MATEIQDKDGVSVTRFSRFENQSGFQVTWGLNKFVQVDNQDDAEAIAEILRKSLIR